MNYQDTIFSFLPFPLFIDAVFFRNPPEFIVSFSLRALGFSKYLVNLFI